MNKGGNLYWIVGLLVAFLAVDVALATWLLTPPLSRQYLVQPGETLADVARLTRTHEQIILEANSLRPGTVLQPGQMLSIPTPPLGPLLNLPVQFAGLAGTLLGVLMSFWLCRLAGLMPADYAGRILGVTLFVSAVSYLAGQAAARQMITNVTPMFVLDSARAAFAWSVSVPLMASALGFRADSAV